MFFTPASKSTTTESTEKFWKGKRNSVYLRTLDLLLEGLSRGCKTICDVGSGGCPHLDMIEGIERKISIDKKEPFEATDVEAITQDYVTWQPEKRSDITLCLLTLNRLTRPAFFARKLMANSNIVIVSVPYKCTGEAAERHTHKDIDENMMRGWFDRTPSFSIVCREIFTDEATLIQVYERNGDVWSNLQDRNRLRAERKAKQQGNSQ